MIEKENRVYTLFCFLKGRAIALLKEGESLQETENVLMDYLEGFGLLERRGAAGEVRVEKGKKRSCLAGTKTKTCLKTTLSTRFSHLNKRSFIFKNIPHIAEISFTRLVLMFVLGLSIIKKKALPKKLRRIVLATGTWFPVLFTLMMICGKNGFVFTVGALYSLICWTLLAMITYRLAKENEVVQLRVKSI